MASAFNRPNPGFSMSTLAKADELKKRIWFVILALLVYRVGTYIPLPGIDPQIWDEIFSQKSGGVLDMFNMFSGGALSRMSIFALNIMPYISASIVVQLLSSMLPQFEQLKKEGEAGRKKLNQYTRILTVILAVIQAYGLAVGLEHMQGATGSAVVNPGLFFKVTTIITIVGGTIFLMWIGEQITARGIGNGISLIIFAGIVAHLPTAIAGLFELGREGSISTFAIFLIAVMAFSVITFVVFMENAQRRVTVQYPKRMVGANKMTGGDTSHMPLKLNTAGVIPPIFASSLLLLPLTIVGFSGGQGNEVMDAIARYMAHGQPLYMIMYAVFIIFFCFFYTAIVFNPEETAENLRKYGGFIPGYRPGKNTADFLDFILTRITVIGAAYITFICLLPEFMISQYNLPFYFGGTSLLIVVSVTLDTMTQIQSHLYAHQYEGLLKKSRIRGRKA